MRSPLEPGDRLQRGFTAALDAFVPRRCAATDQVITAGWFAADALDTLEPDPGRDEDELVEAAFLFGGALRDAVVRAKFQPDEGRARAIAGFLEDRLRSGDLALPAPVDAVTFVPAHWRRRVARGFDLPVILAEAVGRACSLPVIDALVCTAKRPPLSRAADRDERQALTQGSYARRSEEPLPGRMLLVDDVKTTGATLDAASEPLRAVGVEVVPWALARVP